MSVHSSIKRASSAAKKSVLSRIDRIKVLKAAGKWDETKRTVGLPKTDPLKLLKK